MKTYQEAVSFIAGNYYRPEATGAALANLLATEEAVAGVYGKTIHEVGTDVAAAYMAEEA